MSNTVIEHNKVKKTYVMKGDFTKKELNIYHLILAPSYACNLRCAHCYLPDHSTKIIDEQKVLSLIDEWSDNVLAERGKYGGIFHLKGGEPLILPYFEKVISKMAELQTLRFMMTTNGTYYNYKTIEMLSELSETLEGNVTIIISLDGSNDSINSIIRGKGNFSTALNFARLLISNNVNVHFNYVVHKKNIDDIPDFFYMARDMGVTQINFLSFVPKGYGESLEHFRPNPFEVYKKISELWHSIDLEDRSILSGSLSDIIENGSCESCPVSECVGGYRGLFYIEPDGNVFSCPNLNYKQLIIGNILNDTITKLLELTKYKVYRKIETKINDDNDRFLCKGEKFLISSTSFLEKEFPSFQKSLYKKTKHKVTPFCFSRNF